MNQKSEENGFDVSNTDRLSTGVSGVDEILHGGLIPSRSYLVHGEPGTGKTILGLHYLTTGTAADETSLYVNLEESTEDIKLNAAALGFDLSDVQFLDLSPKSDFFSENQLYDLFDSGTVEHDPIVDRITERITSLAPDRLFVDPLTQLRHLSVDEYQFYKQTLSFMRLASESGATVLFTTQSREGALDEDLQFMSDGIIAVRRSDSGRRISAPKFRGSATQTGQHALRITETGIEVYPQLEPSTHRVEFTPDTLSSGIPELDALLDGGIERGTVSIISGPTGVGKTTTATQFMKEAAGRGERSVIYLFEEMKQTLLTRSAALNIPVEQMLEQGTLHIEEVEALKRSAQEFAYLVRTDIEENNSDIVMIDGIRGYELSLSARDEATEHLHALCRYLTNLGVTVILIDEVGTIAGEFQATNGSTSYLADNLVFLRHLELHGEMRKAIGVLKKRTSDFERTLRRFEMTEHGITVGAPLTELRGILTGTPERIKPTHSSRTE